MESNAPFTARLYGQKTGDYQLVSGWWRARHGGALTETILPPLGVIVEDEKGPLAALWCYQTVGIGVCILEFAITRPNSSFKQSRKGLLMAAEACIQIAKAQGDYSYFRAITTPAMARCMARLGFEVEGGSFVQMRLRRDK